MEKLIPFPPRRARPGGYTIIEMMTVTVILGVLAIGFSQAVRSMTKSSMRLPSRQRGQQNLRSAFQIAERDLLQMNQILQADSDEVVFLLDSYRLPKYDGTTLSPRGVPLLEDPDDDNDRKTLPTNASDFWRIGDDLDDDDEDGVAGADVICRYFFNPATGELSRSFRYNTALGAWTGAGWEAPKVVLPHLAGFKINYFGSFETDAKADTNADRIIDEDELKLFDPARWMNRVTYFDVRLSWDDNADGKEDSFLTVSLTPLLMPLKRKLYE